MSISPLYSMRGICKSFPGVRVLDHVELSLYAGEVTALMGENGAGKSTLVKIMTGIYQPDEGEIHLAGEPVVFRNAHEAHKNGMTAIHQETVLFDHLSVEENIFIGQYIKKPSKLPGIKVLDWPLMREKATEILQTLEVDISPQAPLAHLSIAQKHMVSIARALAFDARIVILDEPTAALSHREIQDLYALINRLKAQGKAILFISHKLDEIFHICDRYHIFRDGEHIAKGKIDDITEEAMVSAMVGRNVDQVYPKREVALGDEVMSVNRLSYAQEFADISFSIKKGEIIGFYGLVGSGRTEVMQALFGVVGKVDGQVIFDGESVAIQSPRDAIAKGLVYVPEERQSQGAILEFPISQNISLPQLNRVSSKGMINASKEKALAEKFFDKLQVKASGIEQQVGNLSGGNQQKVVIGKWLATQPKVVILDEPTKGIDIGSKSAVHEFMGQLVEQGMAVIMVSSELPEVLGISDRVYVMSEGRITRQFSRDEASPEKVIAAAIGSH